MNRTIINLLAVLSLTSCTADHLKELNKGSVIDFHIVTTRATETTAANFTSFEVTALNPEGSAWFTKEEFTKDGEYFYSATDHYWPSDGTQLRFYAYSPASADINGAVLIGTEKQVMTGFNVADDITDQIDFISAKATGDVNTSAGGVELTFSHNLAQIEIKARNGNSGYIHKVTGVRLGNITSGGDFDFTASQWSPGNTQKNYTTEYSTPKELGVLSTSIMNPTGNNAMFIPQQITPWNVESDPSNTGNGAYIAVKIQITTASGARIYPLINDYDWVAVPVEAIKWEAGYRYVYTLDFTKSGGYVYPEKEAPAEGSADTFLAGDRVMGDQMRLGAKVEYWSYNNNNSIVY